MFSIPTISAIKYAIALGAVLIFSTLSAYTMHRIDAGTLAKVERDYALAQGKAVSAALVLQKKQDDVMLHAAVAEGLAQQQITIQALVITKEIPTYVHDFKMVPCVSFGLVRVLDAAVLGVAPDKLPLPAGQSNDTCTTISAAALAEHVTANYGTARANAEQLNALSSSVSKVSGASGR